jgi:hypothetical protein
MQYKEEEEEEERDLRCIYTWVLGTLVLTPLTNTMLASYFTTLILVAMKILC